MKKSRVIILALILFLVCIVFSACTNRTITQEYQLIRIHIRANSNETQDQDVKLLVRDVISSYLSKELENVCDFETAYEMLGERIDEICSLSDEVLRQNGFSYKAKARLNNEFFPVRSYENVVVESGYYDALIIELGSGKGDNWWCVIYPPLCYLEAEGEGDFAYKSYIKEIWDKYFG